MNFKAIKITVREYKTNPTRMASKILALPFIVPMLVFFTIRDNLKPIILVIGMGIIVAISGCSVTPQTKAKMDRVARTMQAFGKGVQGNQSSRIKEDMRWIKYEQQQQRYELRQMQDAARRAKINGGY